ncbi:MAG: hypothetical protein KatS3mg082_2978 [Nitrospiraceae bacterium]|nr:MAG: hypothetical protein KatS3mg015_1029 [Fimbriimonadales bacterium]GIW56545.1 MAG: hypothetical protein KatS3mg082_2949 [Nitrospiraceae bacterium]GIW56574.1 MAG: hypothetical protein KatS3mg082_2978 [Nitrospiraceae bacterium]
MDRRDLLKAALAAASATALAGCGRGLRNLLGNSDLGFAEPLPNPEPIARTLNRVGYGFNLKVAKEVAEKGREAWIESQIAADEEEDPWLVLQIERLDVFRLGPAELRDLPEEEVVRQLQQATILRAVYSRNQLLERMVEFWSDHFNIYARKRFEAWRKPMDEISVIRRHALGKFPDLLRASAKSPAMLEYLDNDRNNKAKPNENYARELMELHTLGVHGGYTQEDVQQVARCFTGWTIENRFGRARGTFRFDESQHDFGEKVVLGHRIPAGGGVEDGEQVLQILATHPSTAKFIAGKLVARFLGDGFEGWRDRLAEIYLQTGGDIRAMLRPLLLSDDLLHAPPLPKRPFDFVASSLRALAAATDGRGVLPYLRAMGQPSHEWPMPDGYPNETESWTGSLLARWNFAIALLSGDVKGVQIDEILRQQPVEAILGRKPGEDPLSRLIAERRDPRERIALCLCSPEFQWR